jgi:hypothetical protein
MVKTDGVFLDFRSVFLLYAQYFWLSALQDAGNSFHISGVFIGKKYLFLV